jgi:hypothetical protein
MAAPEIDSADGIEVGGVLLKNGKIGKIVMDDAVELTISSGTIAVTQTWHRVDTESDGPTDDLTTINGGTNGQWLILQAATIARTVVVKNSVDNLILESDFSMDNTSDFLLLMGDAGHWFELSRSNNGA